MARTDVLGLLMRDSWFDSLPADLAKLIVKHSFDVVKHFLNGNGTNPIDMHEYIVEDSAEQAADHISHIDLGYQLV